MPDSKENVSRKSGADSVPGKTALSRREFLKLTGLAGAAVGLGAGLGGLTAACGTDSTTTSVAETTTSIATATTTAGGGSSTSAAATGREIKIGFVSPLTGPIALFGVPDQYCAERWKEAVSGGLVCGDGKSHPITIYIRDSQSDANRAAQVAGDLINNDKVDVIMCASTADTVNPVADQAEALGCPCFSNDAPWQSYWLGRGAPAEGFKWTWHHFWGLEDIIGTFVDMWDGVQTNKKVAGMWPNDADGIAWANSEVGFPAVLPTRGYAVVDPGRFQDLTEDFTAQISQFKKGGCEILTGVPLPPDFTNLWKQSVQQGFKPKVATVGKALLFPGALEALGDIGYGMSTEIWWTPRHPWVSSLTGETCQEIADDFEKRTGIQWTQPLLHYGVFEVVVDALKRCADVDDKEAIVAAISSTKMETLAGPLDFTSPVDPNSKHPVKNVYRSPLVGGQWVQGTKHPYDLIVTNNSMAPEIEIQGALRLLAF